MTTIFSVSCFTRAPQASCHQLCSDDNFNLLDAQLLNNLRSCFVSNKQMMELENDLSDERMTKQATGFPEKLNLVH